LENIESKYVATPTGYLMVLTDKDNVITALSALAEKENVPSATFFGIGFAGVATFGFYNFDDKVFVPKTYNNMELASLNGSIAWQNGKPSIHAHGTTTGADYLAWGGHILDLEVGTGSIEITILRHEKRLERKIDPTIQANVLQVR
jgi:predicted DNA-binding protein with PD1-like motif